MSLTVDLTPYLKALTVCLAIIAGYLVGDWIDTRFGTPRWTWRWPK